MVDRYEINHEGKIVIGNSALCSDQDLMLVKLFSQYGRQCKILDKEGACRILETIDTTGKLGKLNVYCGSIRNEARNPYEKKIQLGMGSDPRSKSKEDTIILGIYVYKANDSISDAIFVGYPIDDATRYDTNPSIRGTYINRVLIQAKNDGFVYDGEHNTVAFRAEFIFYYLANFYSIHYSHESVKMMTDVDYEAGKSTPQKNKIAENIILYGVPGCGKSHYLKNEYLDGISTEQYERVVFHPDYTYSDFVGQILPQNTNGHISYTFVPGPFTRILKKAIRNKEQSYYLIIEELNRGNAPAIFGEIFQLLDRTNGVSDYEINNSDIAKEIYLSDSDIGNVQMEQKAANTKIRLPQNLFILATMNTADQNVFTLDTAFKRRWRMKSIPNDIDKCWYKNSCICGSEITWGEFFKVINNEIEEMSHDNISSEDRRLGAFFASINEIDNDDLFSEKVLMYLWNDVFKYDPDKVFKSGYKTLEQLIKDFKTNKFDVFSISFNGKNNQENISDAANKESITTDQYLAGKTDTALSLYRNLIEKIDNTGLEYTLGAVNDYISLKAQSGQIAAEIHLQKTNIRVLVKEPTNVNCRIGTLLPNTYGWSKNYQLILDENTDINVIVSAIIDSYNQVNG